MEKIQVSTEVYKALQDLQSFNTNQEIFDSHVNKKWKLSEYHCLNEIDNLTMANILLNGYQKKEYVNIIEKISLIDPYELATMIHVGWHSSVFKKDPELCTLWDNAEKSIKLVEEYLEDHYDWGKDK